MKKKLLLIISLISFGVNAQSWTEKATGFSSPNISLNSISIVDDNVIWASAFDITDFEHPDYTVKEFTKSIDSGETWTTGAINLGPNSEDMEISSITAVSDQIAWISVSPGATNTGGIWQTTDGGVTWTKQSTASFSSADSWPNFVHFWDTNNGVAQGDPENNEFEIYTTNDGGTTWTRVPAANTPDATVGSEYGYYNIYTVSGDNIWFGTDLGRIFKSTDKGLSWTAYNSGVSTDFGLDRFSFSDANKGILMTHDDLKLYSTIDGGETWNSITTPDFFKTDIAYIPGTSTVIASSFADPVGSAYSIDNGLNWIPIDNLIHGQLVFLNNNVGFSAGKTIDATIGGIYKFTSAPLKTPSFTAEKQIAVYPNPTNGILHIDSKTGLKEASVFDLLGRKVYSSKFSASNSNTLDIRSLQSGSYILKTTSNDGSTETTKILKK
ncbi:MAG TPA: T9SS type A sorting domain-containing protein [Flavobacterium sp.]